MSREGKALILAVVLWVFISIPLSRLDTTPTIGIYTLSFIDKLLGVLLALFCMGVSYWFTGNTSKDDE